MGEKAGLGPPEGAGVLQREQGPHPGMPVSTCPDLSPGTCLQVIVYVEDVNDEAPVFTQQQYNRLGLRETAGIGTSVIIVRATDRDTGKAGGGARDATSQSDPPIARNPVILRLTPRLRRGSLVAIHSIPQAAEH